MAIHSARSSPFFVVLFCASYSLKYAEEAKVPDLLISYKNSINYSIVKWHVFIYSIARIDDTPLNELLLSG